MDLWRRLAHRFRRRQFEHELDEEMRIHLDMKSEKQGYYAARRQFGNITLLKEASRETWGWGPFERLGQDIRYAVRQMRRNLGLTSVIVLSLALGIGANTAIFSVINAAMLRKLPVKAPEELVQLATLGKRPSGVTQIGFLFGQLNLSFPYASLERFRAQEQVFSGVFGLAPLTSVSIDGDASASAGEMVTGNYFSALGVSPIAGRLISEEDEKPGAASVVVISYGYWVRRFGRGPSAVGKTLHLNRTPFTIVGVTPPEFFGVQTGRDLDVWVPVSEHAALDLLGRPGPAPLTAHNLWWFMIMGRLKPGITAQQARAASEVIFQQSLAAGLNPPPKPEEIPRLELMPASRGLDNLRRAFASPLLILMTVVGLVLVIACANVATLLLARATARQKEIGMRLSLGASRARLIRQLLTESVLLAGFGGALGLLFAYWGSRALLLMMATRISLDVRPDAAVLAFTAAVSMLCGILFGLAPAVRATRMDLAPALKEGTPSASPAFGLGKLLTVAQVAMSLVLLIGAGLFVRTLANLQNQDLGFDRHSLLLFGLDPVQKGYKGPQLVQLYTELLERFRAMPGVRSATVSQVRLISRSRSSSTISIERHTPEPGQNMNVYWTAVGPEFFETMGMRVLLGRDIERRDNESSPKVAVVNEAMARRYFGDANPIGRRFGFSPLRLNDALEIVGVVQDAKYDSLRDDPQPTAYLAYAQRPPGRMYFAVRTASDPAAVVPAIRHVVQTVEPDLPLLDVKTQVQQIEETLRLERLFARLTTFFGILALLLASIGLYGTMAYAVSRRSREIGIRMALGAERRKIAGMVLRDSLVLLALGAVAGVPLAVAATQFVRSFLYGLSPSDPAVLAGATLVLVVATMMASYLPARRAARVDPMIALRHE